MQSKNNSTEMQNLSCGAATVKRKLSVRETASVIRRTLTLKRKSGLRSAVHMLQNQRSEKRRFLVEKNNDLVFKIPLVIT